MTAPMPGFDPLVLACLTVDELRRTADVAAAGRVKARKVFNQLSERGVDRSSLTALAAAEDRWELSWWNVQRELDRRGEQAA